MSTDVRRHGFAIRAATPDDAKACRMLLPHLYGQGRFLVGVEGRSGLIVAAAAVTHSRRHTPPTGPGVGLHVIPPCRGAGVGAALLTYLADYARRCGDDMLYAARKVDVADEEFAAWRQMKFDVVEQVQQHELHVASLLPRLTAVVEALRRSGQIPAAARIVPLYAADREAVLQLHLAHLGGDRETLRARLHGQGADPFQPRYSRALVLDDQVVGCLLAHRTGSDAASVDAVVVAPELRLGWANAWLRLEACQGAQSIGVSRIAFATFDRYQDTRSFAGQFPGAVLRTWGLLGRTVSTIPPPPTALP